MINFIKKIFKSLGHTQEEIFQSAHLSDIIIQDFLKLFEELDDVELDRVLKVGYSYRGIPVSMSHPKGYTIINMVLHKESHIEDSSHSLISKDKRRIYVIVEEYFKNRIVKNIQKRKQLAINNILNAPEKTVS